MVLFAVLFFHLLKMVPYTANKTETQKRPTTATANKIAMKPRDYFAVCGLRFLCICGTSCGFFFPSFAPQPHPQPRPQPQPQQHNRKPQTAYWSMVNHFVRFHIVFVRKVKSSDALKIANTPGC